MYKPEWMSEVEIGLSSDISTVLVYYTVKLATVFNNP